MPAKASSLPRQEAVAEPVASRRVYRGIMAGLEDRRLVPGQRLSEGDLATQFGVGRNAVREALQWLAAEGVIASIRHRSSVIRRLDHDRALGLVDIVSAIFLLVARGVATADPAPAELARLDTALAAMTEAAGDRAAPRFARARRHYYTALLAICGNREIERLFPSLGLPVLFAQLAGADIETRQAEELALLRRAIGSRDPGDAERAIERHVATMRSAIATNL